MDINLTEKLIAQANEYKPRVLHRYNCSEIWGLLNGYTTPEQWLRGEKKNFKNAYQMWQGTWKHKQIQSLLPEVEQELKTEKKVGNLTIVGIADLIDKDRGYEIKTSEKLHKQAKSWHIFQSKLYCILFDRPEWVIVQPVLGKGYLKLKEIGRVKKNLAWFNETMEQLKEKDNEIEKINEVLQIIREDTIAEQWKERDLDEDLELQRIKEDPDLQLNK